MPLATSMTFLTSIMALPCRMPFGSPVRGSRTISPFSGSGVSFVIPASCSALEFATLLPNTRSNTTG